MVDDFSETKLMIFPDPDFVDVLSDAPLAKENIRYALLFAHDMQMASKCIYDLSRIMLKTRTQQEWRRVDGNRT